MQSSIAHKQQSKYQGLFHLIKPFLFFLLLSCAHSSDIDISQLIDDAKKQNKHIMFFHHIPGCPYCKSMLNENFKDEKILKVIKKDFIHVDIYTANKGAVTYKDFKGSFKEFSAHIGAFVFPSTIFMDFEGKIVHKAIGYRNIG